jgi:hypothetical protein
MKTFLALAALLLAACKPSKPPMPVVAEPAGAVPPAESPVDQNRAEKYVSGLQADVKRAQEAKEKADAAIKKTDDSQKALQQAEGQ